MLFRSRGDLNMSDLFSAVTQKSLEGVFAHTGRYYRKRGLASYSAEAFANLTDIYGRKNRSGWNYVAKNLPETARAFLRLLGE